MALKPCKLRPEPKGITKYTQIQTKADRKPEGPSRDHLCNSVRGSKTLMKEEKDIYFVNKDLSLYNRFSPLEGLEEDPFYFPNHFVKKRKPFS